jgi:hypothetical protein
MIPIISRKNIICKTVNKNRGFYCEDLWNIKYLPKFKWENLIEK